MAPIVCHMYDLGLIEARAYHQNTVFEAAIGFTRAEGHLPAPAPETAHAVRAAMDEAMLCKETGEARAIVFNASGHGHFDLTSYQKFMAGELKDFEYPEDELGRSKISQRLAMSEQFSNLILMIKPVYC